MIARGDVWRTVPSADLPATSRSARTSLVAFMPMERLQLRGLDPDLGACRRGGSFTTIHIENCARPRNSGRGDHHGHPNVGGSAREARQAGIAPSSAPRSRRATSSWARSRRGQRRSSRRGEAAPGRSSAKAYDVKDTSLRVPPGMDGTVIDYARVHARRRRRTRALSIEVRDREGACQGPRGSTASSRRIFSRVHAMLIGKVAAGPPGSRPARRCRRTPTS